MENQDPNNIDTTLKINDLETIRQALDLAATRGAFKANEMRRVGEVFDKLCFFLDNMQVQMNAQAPESEQGE